MAFADDEDVQRLHVFVPGLDPDSRRRHVEAQGRRLPFREETPEPFARGGLPGGSTPSRSEAQEKHSACGEGSQRPPKDFVLFHPEDEQPRRRKEQEKHQGVPPAEKELQEAPDLACGGDGHDPERFPVQQGPEVHQQIKVGQDEKPRRQTAEDHHRPPGGGAFPGQAEEKQAHQQHPEKEGKSPIQPAGAGKIARAENELEQGREAEHVAEKERPAPPDVRSAFPCRRSGGCGLRVHRSVCGPFLSRSRSSSVTKRDRHTGTASTL